MKPNRLPLLTAALIATPAVAGPVIISDNFNAPDNASLDASPLSGGRMGGLLGSSVQLRSSIAQHGITMGMLRILRTASNEPRIRFHDISGLVRHNWASGPEAATITTDGGLRVEFDWHPANISDTSWVEFSVGVANDDVTQRVNAASTDIGILFRDNGTAAQSFDNGTAVNGAALPAALITYLPRHVVITYAFTSWTDASQVTANAWVDGFQVVTNRVADWNGNAATGVHFELGSNINGNLIDNFSISTLAADADTDADGLPDAWEMLHAGNLVALSNTPGTGNGTGDFDADGLSNLEEYNLSRSRTWSGISPLMADTDSDGLSDFAEANPTAPRLVTDPTKADTDGDGASDFAENSSGSYVDLNNTGTNPQLVDTDLDNFPDGYEALRGGNPLAVGTGPADLPGGVSIGIVTDEASAVLSTPEVYTVKVSGGAAATVNGVALDVLNATTTPANLTWDGGVGGKSIIGPAINNGNPTNGWFPATGNVTGTGNLTLYGTFALSGNGSTFYNRQRFTLSNLEPGRPYEYRLYIRKWDNTTVRPSDVKLINGTETKNVFTLLDRPAIMTGSGNTETAYYISFNYVAQASSVVVEAMVPRIPAANGSHHMYGMTNRVAGPPADTDSDGISDFWETAKAGDLTTLGAEPADYDNDGLTDKAEYLASTTFTAINPLDADSDDDGLNDGPEIAGAGSRPPTSPVDSDSDDDGLLDGVESNTGVFVDAANTGSNPLLVDTDSDAFTDSAEVTGGTNPNLASSRPALPPGISYSILTDDASTGVDSTNNYTHKISGGRAVSINGVAFDALTDTATPANFAWDTGTFAKSPYVTLPGLNNWVPATGNVTGTGLLDLLTSFTYSGTGANAGSTQKFTLTGLTPGLQYEFKFFTRAWDQGGSGRPIDLTFTNGTEVAQIWPGHYLLTDRPGGTTITGNHHVAYALTFTYVAQGTSLVIDANVPAGAVNASGSFHMYGLTNREAGPPPVLDFTNINRAADGSSTSLTWVSRPGRVYKVEFSTDLVNWIELTDAQNSQGISTTYVDNVASNLSRAQYRITDVTP